MSGHGPLPPVVDFHCHYVPAAHSAAVVAAPPEQRRRWGELTAKMADATRLLAEVESGDLAARVVNIPVNLIAGARETLPPAEIAALNDTLAALVECRDSSRRRDASKRAASGRDEPSMNRCQVAAMLPACALLLSVAQADARQLCRPALAIGDVAFSEMRPPSRERIWTAVVTVDASRCATSVGRFSIGFLRIKEDGGELEFRESFTWSPPALRVSVRFWADEAVESSWIDEIDPCPCHG